MVEVVSSLRRDGQPVERDLRWGVYVVFKAESDYAASCFKQYGLPTDSTGRYAAMYKPYHLIGLELSISVLNVALRGEPTGTCREWRGDAVAVAKRAFEGRRNARRRGWLHRLCQAHSSSAQSQARWLAVPRATS
jgi:predicted homoserine dehydrogenase-like protein